jgi:CBS domain-containing protein
MSPRSLSHPLVRDAPVLTRDDPVGDAVHDVLDAGLPALPVADLDGRLCGIFGEREFLTALFPGYLGELHYVGFVPRSLESALQKRASCRNDPISKYMNTDHVEVGPDFSDAQVAETFLHHRVLIVPVADDGRVLGVITRSDFFRAVAERFLSAG